MTDPTFTTREELEAWANKLRCFVNTTRDCLAVIVITHRVTLAHGHLFEEAK